MSSTKSKKARHIVRRVRDFSAEKSLSPLRPFGRPDAGARRAAEPLLATRRAFSGIVWRFWHAHGRHDLPWRKTHDPYKILVSEVMLQQTQVERVVPFYKKFIKKFPTAKKLAAAPLFEVLKSWQGLGYNRRAKMLHAAVKELTRKNIQLSSYRTDLVYELEQLPGVGPYTARAIAAFAFNQDVIFVETNIRTAVMHHFFSRPASRGGSMIYHTSQSKVSDADITQILLQALPKGNAREWYSALMDYGAYLKKSGIKLNAKSKHYAKQSKFSGSLREARGVILRELARKPQCQDDILTLLGPDRTPQLRIALAALLAEHLIQKRGMKYRLAR